MNLRNNKGVTLIILCLTIAVLITISKSSSQLAIRNLNYLYSDIETINTSISDYYLKNVKLPTKGEYCSDKATFAKMLGGLDKINQEDSGKYYVIDLSELDSLTLNYGREYSKWSSASSTYNDIYVINETTHQVYYVRGIELDGEMYYTNIAH